MSTGEMVSRRIVNCSPPLIAMVFDAQVENGRDSAVENRVVSIAVLNDADAGK